MLGVNLHLFSEYRSVYTVGIQQDFEELILLHKDISTLILRKCGIQILKNVPFYLPGCLLNFSLHVELNNTGIALCRKSITFLPFPISLFSIYYRLFPSVMQMFPDTQKRYTLPSRTYFHCHSFLLLYEINWVCLSITFPPPSLLAISFYS